MALLLFSNQSPRSRALDMFAHLRVRRNTEHNNGVLIYLLLATIAMWKSWGGSWFQRQGERCAMGEDSAAQFKGRIPRQEF